MTTQRVLKLLWDPEWAGLRPKMLLDVLDTVYAFDCQAIEEPFSLLRY